MPVGRGSSRRVEYDYTNAASAFSGYAYIPQDMRTDEVSRKPQRKKSDVKVKASSEVPTLPTPPPQSSSVKEEFTKLLECPVCFSIPKSEIFNCENGHSTCGPCRYKLAKCALCANRFTNARNFIAESVISHLLKYGVPITENSQLNANCIYQGEGCKKATNYAEVDGHIRECDFRPVRCNVESSTKCLPQPMLKLSEFFQHLKTVHKINGLVEASGIFSKVDRLFSGIEINVAWPPYYLQYDGRTFLRYASIRNRNITWWIQLIGCDEDATKYQAQFSVESPNRKVLKLAWTVPVHPIRKTRHEIEHSKDVATISTKRILPFCAFNEPFGERIATHLWTQKIVLSRIE